MDCLINLTKMDITITHVYESIIDKLQSYPFVLQQFTKIFRVANFITQLQIILWRTYIIKFHV